jgi:hypothetical protein
VVHSVAPEHAGRDRTTASVEARAGSRCATPLLAIGNGGPNYFALYLGAVVAALLGAVAVLPIKTVR